MQSARASGGPRSGASSGRVGWAAAVRKFRACVDVLKMKWLRYGPCVGLVCENAHVALVGAFWKGYLEVRGSHEPFWL